MQSLYNKTDLNHTFSCCILVAEDLTFAWPSEGNPCLYFLFNCKVIQIWSHFSIHKCQEIYRRKFD